MPTTTAKSRSDLHRESLRKTLQSLAEADDKTKALLGLDQFIKDKPPQDLHFKALEIRCSINISLGNLAVATKDGKEICRLQPQSCKGYIRLAKILSKQGEVDKVTRIYDHALTVLSRGSKDYDTVAGLREKWVVMLARRRKKCDMFEFLPAEILDEILSYMRFRDIVRFLGVSRSWHNYIEARPHFWRYIDLRDIKRPLGLKPLIACLKKSRESIQELRLGPLQDAAYDKVVRLIGQVGRQAKVLEFKDLKRTLPVPKEFSASTGLLSCLKELYLSRTTAWDIAVILSKVRTLEVLEVLDVMQSDSIDWNCCVAQLKRLRVGKMERFSGRALELDEWAEVLSLPCLTNLTSVHIDNAPSENSEPFPIFHKLQHLTNLALFSASPRRPFIDLPPTLTHLTINERDGRQPHMLLDPSLIVPEQPLFLSFPNLTHIDLSSTRITFTEFIIMVRSTKPVFINLNRCISCEFDIDEFKRVVDVGDIEDLYLEGQQKLNDQYSLEFSPAPYTVKSFYGGGPGYEEVKRGFEKLKRLDLSHTNITGIGFLNIVRTGRGENVRIEDGNETDVEELKRSTKLEWIRYCDNGPGPVSHEVLDVVGCRDGVKVIRK